MKLKVGDRFKVIKDIGIGVGKTGTILEPNGFKGGGHRASIDGSNYDQYWVDEEDIELLNEPEKVDITREVRVEVWTLKTLDGALIELFDGDQAIGLFDRKHGFSYMNGAEENYLVEDYHQSDQEACWFKVYRLKETPVEEHEIEDALEEDFKDTDAPRAVLVRVDKLVSRKPFIIYGEPKGEIVTTGAENIQALEKDRDQLNKKFSEVSYSIWHLDPGQTLEEFAEEHNFQVIKSGLDEADKVGIDENTSHPRYVLIVSGRRYGNGAIIWSDHYEGRSQTHCCPIDEREELEATRDRLAGYSWGEDKHRYNYHIELIGTGETLAGFAKENGYTIA